MSEESRRLKPNRNCWRWCRQPRSHITRLFETQDLGPPQTILTSDPDKKRRVRSDQERLLKRLDEQVASERSKTREQIEAFIEEERSERLKAVRAEGL